MDSAIERQYRAIFDAAPLPTWVCDTGGWVLAVNDAAIGAYGYSHREWAALRLEDIAAGPGRQRRRDGSLAEVELAVREIELSGARVRVVSAADAAPWRRMEALDRERMSAVEMIARNAGLEVVLARLSSLVEQCCPGLQCALFVLRHGRLFQAAGAAALDSFLGALDALPIEADGDDPAAPFWALAPRLHTVLTDPHWAPWSAAAIPAGVNTCWSSALVSGAGEMLGALAAYSPSPSGPALADRPFLESAAKLAALAIEQQNLVEDLVYQAEHDTLTRLPNRFRFDDRLGQALRLADRAGHLTALLHIDLDRFRSVNNLFGRAVGDALLEQVARRMEGCLRKSDTLARAGGAEFTLLLPELAQAAGAEAVAAKLMESFEEPFQVLGHEVFLTASIGISIYPRDAADSVALLRNASEAVQRAKNQGRHNVQAFTADMDRACRQRLEIERHLRHALERGELTLHFQPQYDLRCGAMRGAEALLRWESAALGSVSPAVFIPAAEESGLILPIGRWVLEEACRQRMRWPARLAGRIAVNASAVQFARPDFVALIVSTLEHTGLDPSLLEVELTETAVMRDLEQASRHMKTLSNLGIAISMDDFGTGYSSLSNLQRLPFDAVKIDQSFVREIRSAAERPPVISSIIGMARALGKRLIAEGIETPAQREAVAAMGCDLGQGYLLCRPAPADRLPLPPVEPQPASAGDRLPAGVLAG